MAAAPPNRALWQDTFGVPGVIRSNSTPTSDELSDHKVLVKVHAWAINPCDHMLQDRNMAQYPLVLGCDVAGTVEAVPDAGSKKFKVGDRIFGFNANNGFQDYVAVEDKLIAKIPDGMAYRDVVGFGLCSATCAMFLFGKDYLHLDGPKLGGATKKKGKSVLIWGGSSAVGSNSIQLATAAGYDVITTCSKRNFDYVKSLGAVAAFDYSEAGVTDKIAAELDRGECAGIFMAAGLDDGNAKALKVAGASKQRVKFASSSFMAKFDDVPEGVDVKQLTPDTFVPFPDCWFETTHATFEGYLPEALAAGEYKVAPPPLVINRKGLEGLQEGIDIQRAVSEKGQAGIKEALERAGHDLKGEKPTVVKVVVERP